MADKYQTGFDQPLLHTMYVDKRLDGIQAVQTLSRLNRMHPLKEDTFVLDFVNDRETIRVAFKQFYEGAEMGEEADPAQMYKMRADLDAAGVYRPEDVQRFVAVFFKPRERQTTADHRALYAALDPAVARFEALRTEPAGGCRAVARVAPLVPHPLRVPRAGHPVRGQRARTAVRVPSRTGRAAPAPRDVRLASSTSACSSSITASRRSRKGPSS